MVLGKSDYWLFERPKNNLEQNLFEAYTAFEIFQEIPEETSYYHIIVNNMLGDIL